LPVLKVSAKLSWSPSATPTKLHRMADARNVTTQFNAIIFLSGDPIESQRHLGVNLRTSSSVKSDTTSQMPMLP